MQNFGGTALPTTTQELYQAFAVYYALPALTIETRMDGNTMYVDAATDGTGTYTYQWEYLDENGNWLPLCEDTTSTINASAIDLLQDGGKEIRCSQYEGEQIKSTSNTLFVNPKRQLYDNAIAEINSGLSLGDLEINGTQFTDYFYYGNVAKDSRVPFSDAQSYADYLAKLYLDNGGETLVWPLCGLSGASTCTIFMIHPLIRHKAKYQWRISWQRFYLRRYWTWMGKGSSDLVPRHPVPVIDR